MPLIVQQACIQTHFKNRFTDGVFPRAQADSLYAEMDEIFAGHRADVRYAVINLPMFLENLLYQTERLRGFRGQGEEGATSPPSFSFPLKRDTVFSYVTCKSLGELATGTLVEFDLLCSRMLKESARHRGVR